jgi:hypothetical protein
MRETYYQIWRPALNGMACVWMILWWPEPIVAVLGSVVFGLWAGQLPDIRVQRGGILIRRYCRWISIPRSKLALVQRLPWQRIYRIGDRTGPGAFFAVSTILGFGSKSVLAKIDVPRSSKRFFFTGSQSLGDL